MYSRFMERGVFGLTTTCFAHYERVHLCVSVLMCSMHVNICSNGEHTRQCHSDDVIFLERKQERWYLRQQHKGKKLFECRKDTLYLKYSICIFYCRWRRCSIWFWSNLKKEKKTKRKSMYCTCIGLIKYTVCNGRSLWKEIGRKCRTLSTGKDKLRTPPNKAPPNPPLFPPLAQYTNMAIFAHLFAINQI